MEQKVTGVHEAYQLAQNYINRLAPDENIFYHAWVCHRYYIFDFLPVKLDPGNLTAPNDKKTGLLASLFHGKEVGSAAGKGGQLLATGDGYTAFSYGKFGPVLVEKSSGECFIHPLNDLKGLDHYRTLIEHAKTISVSEDRLSEGDGPAD